MLTKDIIINNKKIRYAEQRDGDGPVCIFLHGWGSNYKLFSNIYNDLDNFLAFDFPGFGESSKLKEVMSLRDYADLTHKIILQNAHGKEIIFVVHSFGGRVMLKMLDMFHDVQVKKIVCIGVPFVRQYGKKERIKKWCTKIVGWPKYFLPQGIVRRCKLVWYSILGLSDYAQLSDTHVKETFIATINEDLTPYFEHLKKHKTFFIWGANDVDAPIGQAQDVAAQVDAKLYIINHAGHFPFLGETSKQFLQHFKEISEV